MSLNNPNSSHFELHLTASAPEQTALQILSEHCPLSKQKLKTSMKNGAVWLESSTGIQRIRRATKTLSASDRLHFYYDKSIQETTPPAAGLIADEAQYSVWHKPCGMYSQGTKWGDHCTIYRYVEAQLKPQRPAFIVHRLDRSANGLIILAHSKKIAATFSEMFKKRKIQKQYTAIVEGRLKKTDLPFTISSNIEGKDACSKIMSVQNFDESCRLIIEIDTGRKHQIRRHMAELGHPVVGDRLYGSGKAEKDLQLQASCLSFLCPLTNKKREYSL